MLPYPSSFWRSRGTQHIFSAWMTTQLALEQHRGGSAYPLCKHPGIGTSLVAQWLGRHAPNAGGLGLIPGQGTRSLMLRLRVCMPELKIQCATTKTQRSQMNTHFKQQSEYNFLACPPYSQFHIFRFNQPQMPRFPGWLSGKESTCQCRTCRFNPWVGEIPWNRKW